MRSAALVVALSAGSHAFVAPSVRLGAPSLQRVAAARPTMLATPLRRARRSRALAASIPGPYPLANLPWVDAAPYFVVQLAMLLTTENIAQASAVLLDDPLLGLMNFIQLWFLCFLFAGIGIPVSHIVWPLRVFCY